MKFKEEEEFLMKLTATEKRDITHNFICILCIDIEVGGGKTCLNLF